MFWFKVGFFTLMKIDSFMVLACPQSSLPMMLKLFSVMVWPVCCKCPWIGEGCLRCSSSSLPEGPCCFPYVHFITIQVLTLVTVYDATFVVLGVLVFGLHKYLFDSGVALEVNLYTILTTYLFDTFQNSFCVGMTTCPTVALFPLLVVLGLLSSLLLCIGLLLLFLVCVFMT